MRAVLDSNAIISLFDDSDDGVKRALMKALLETPCTRLFPVSKETAKFHSRICNQLKKNGARIPTNHIWIAATMFAAGGTLYSSDGHFEHIPLLDWIDGR